MTHFKLLSLVFVLLASLSIKAQELNKFTKKADPLYDANNYFAAIDEYKAAYSKTKDKAQKAEITYRMALCYYETKQMKRAIRSFDKCVSYKYAEENPIVYLYLGEANKSIGKYEDALVHFNSYKEAEPTDKRGSNGAKSCQLSIKWKAEPQRYKVTNMAMLNSKSHDVAPAYASKKNNKIVFSSSRSGAQGESESEKTGQATPDLYSTELDRKGKWSKPSTAPFEESVNTKESEGGPAFDARKSTLYFTKCEIPGKKGEGYCYIYSARKKGAAAYGEAEKVIMLDSVNMAHPSLSKDGKVIYFAAKMEGGYGGYDIWKAEYNRREKKFMAPENLGPQINTSSNEMYPFSHADGTLYFSSNGHMGMGGYDIFKVEAANGGWGPVVNMKSPINSEGDDVSIIFEDVKERGFLASSRAGGKGSLDIYSFVLPKLVFAVQGVVRDMETKEVLPNTTVKLVGSDGSTFEVVTDDAGAYTFEKLTPNANYTVGAKNDAKNKQNKQKYFASDAKMLSTVGVEESKTFTLEIELEVIPIEAIALPNVLYKTADTTLLPESKIALNGLVAILKRNENMTIKIFSHTDFRGTDANNQRLSQGRANSVVAYLVKEKGIEVERLERQGMGEAAPRKITKANEKDIKGICKQFKVKYDGSFKIGDTLSESFIKSLGSRDLQMAAHQFNRRTEFTITGYDYVSAKKKAGNN